MSAPASSDLRELETELVNRAEQGASIGIPEIREMFGVGHTDAQAMLDVLREHGKAVEDAPGEWRGPTQDEIDGWAREEVSPAPVRVTVADPGEDDAARERMGFPPITSGRDRLIGQAGGLVESVRLTRAMVEALDNEALGKLVRAGVEGSDGGFALEVD